MKTVHSLLPVLLLVCTAVPACRRPDRRIEAVPAIRLERLTRGINLSHWFAQARDYTAEHLTTYNTARDIELIKSMGFRHVRFTFDNRTVEDDSKPSQLDPAKMKLFDNALDMLLSAGLAVVVDFHPNHDYKSTLETDDAAVEDFVGMWRALAMHLSSRDPDRVFLEVMNEPVMKDVARWNMIQKKALAAMREVAPEHTLIACGPKWSAVDQLEFIEIVEDANVVYNFHCYEPFFFTHQGANWAGPSVPDLRNLPYPSSAQAIEDILAQLPNEKARENAMHYARANWNSDRIDRLILSAALWAATNGVAVTCNEFGVYRKYAAPEDRNRCIRDVRTACEKHGVGWCMWDYAGGFGVVTGTRGDRVVDRETLRALGLTGGE